MAKKIYVVQTSGITLPGYGREEIKVGVTVELDSKVGEGFCERGFLMDAKKAAPSDGLDSLRAEVTALKKENAELKAAASDGKTLANGQG